MCLSRATFRVATSASLPTFFATAQLPRRTVCPRTSLEAGCPCGKVRFYAKRPGHWEGLGLRHKRDKSAKTRPGLQSRIATTLAKVIRGHTGQHTIGAMREIKPFPGGLHRENI